jgi:nucleoside-diphosphate-sugar epimerase
MKVLVTGANGFIAGYLIPELLRAGYQVVGIDNFSKYGRVAKSYDRHPAFRLVEADAKDVSLLRDLLEDCEHFVAGAAMIGGIAYFHRLAYDLLAENERLTAAAFDAAIAAHRDHRLRKVTVMSSSMVYESVREFPTPEGAQLRNPPPISSYGFQKLAVEYFARAANDQHGLPYTIVRPFNCVGIGEGRALADVEVLSGNIRLALSHVVPDLALKAIKGQRPLRILGDGSQVRHFTYGGDLAVGIRLCMEHPAALNEDFNLSTSRSTRILDLARLIWERVNPNLPFEYVGDDPLPNDVQLRQPDTRKAREMLGFEATTPLDPMLDEVIPWIRAQVDAGRL